MKNKYFNEEAFKYAIKLLENNPYEAKERFKKYLKDYPKDYYARAYYVILLTRICLFKEAEQEYNNIISEINNDNLINYSSKRFKSFKFNMTVAKIKILGYNEQYQELLSFIQNKHDFIGDRDYIYISYYCRKHLGLLDIDTYNEEAYRFNQCIQYSEEVFRNHIKKHESDYNQDTSNPNSLLFAPDFNIDKVILEIKKYIPSNKYLFVGYFDDSYYFKYDNCGRVNNKLTNYFKIICFHNTANFITMYPINECEYLPYVNLNYLKEQENNEVKVKRLSQIDKFNQRFKRN